MPVIGPLGRDIQYRLPVVRKGTVLVVAEPPFHRKILALLQLPEKFLRHGRLRLLLRLHCIAVISVLLYSHIACPPLLHWSRSIGIGRSQQVGEVCLEDLQTLIKILK
jgi:hypothetical protein